MEKDRTHFRCPSHYGDTGMVEAVTVQVPSLRLFRRAVDEIPSRRDRNLVKTLYLSCSRISELVSKVSEGDTHSRGYGRELTYSIQDYEIPAVPEPRVEKALVLKIRVAKRKAAVFKQAAIPTSSVFEPWCLDIMQHLVKQKGEPMFPFTRQVAWHILRKNLCPLDPKIHPHSLRHYRLTHLAEYYGFDQLDLLTLSGWTASGGMGRGAAMLDTYLHLDWKRYFSKLLKPLP